MCDEGGSDIGDVARILERAAGLVLHPAESITDGVRVDVQLLGGVGHGAADVNHVDRVSNSVSRSSAGSSMRPPNTDRCSSPAVSGDAASRAAIGLSSNCLM